MSDARLLVLIVLLPFAGVLIPALLARRSRTTIAWASGVVPLAAFGLLVHLGRRVFAGEVVTASRPWIEFLGLEIAFRLDGLAMLFAGLILAIGLLVIVYARYYLADEDPFGRFHAMLLGFMGAMLGIALSDNLLLTVIFWELTSLSSFLLIGYWSHRPDARTGARMALAVTGMGGLALLAGALVLGDIGGTLSISDLNLQGEAIRAHPGYPLALVLILLGAFTKSAQFPFHFWLPNAMAAPTPVSAYLHSATMVKAGLFLMARLYPTLAGGDLWFWLVGGTGLTTLVFGAWVALTRHDLKSLLAYSTISHLGLITLLLGLGSPLAAVAAVFHIINHATFKASLFMAAGIIDHETGTRDMRRLGGLWQCMPITGVLAMVAAASMAGVPLLNGFLSKEMLFAETLTLSGAGLAGYIVPLAATLAGVFGVAYSMRFIHDVFFNGPPKTFDRTPHEPPRWMRIPVEVLVVLCVAVGVAPAVFVGPLLHVASEAVLGGPVPPFSLSLWHGFNLPLAMSLVAMVAGVALYFEFQRGGRLHAMTPGGWSGHRVYDDLVRLVVRVGEWFTGVAMAGGLRRQVAVLLATSLVAGIAPFVMGGVPDRMFVFQTPMDAVAVTGWIVAAVATALVVAMHRQRFAAVILTGAVGLVVAGAFAHFSGPDLALTQIVVEVATVLLMLLALPHLPLVGALDSSALRRMRDAAFAVVGGIAMGGGAWWMMTRGGTTVSAEQAALSVPGGGGTNVVNVILVDFRGFDTYGEITVLAVAALGIVAMLAREPYSSPRPADAPLMLTLLARILLPFGLLVAVHLFLRGHNLPGGGFVAGLVTAATLVLIPLVAGRAFAERAIRIDFHRVTAAGLAIAGGTGLGAWAFGKPFLSSAHGHLDLPILGDLHWASAALFDLGVYLVVVGVLMLVLQGLARVVPHDVAAGPGSR